MQCLEVYLQWKGQRVFSSEQDLEPEVAYWDTVAGEHDEDSVNTVSSRLTWPKFTLCVGSDAKARLSRLQYPHFRGVIKISSVPSLEQLQYIPGVGAAGGNAKVRLHDMSTSGFRHLAHICALDLSGCITRKHVHLGARRTGEVTQERGTEDPIVRTFNPKKLLGSKSRDITVSFDGTRPHLGSSLHQGQQRHSLGHQVSQVRQEYRPVPMGESLGMATAQHAPSHAHFNSEESHGPSRIETQNVFGVQHRDQTALDTEFSKTTFQRFTERASASMSLPNPFGMQHRDQPSSLTTTLPQFTEAASTSTASQNPFGMQHKDQTTRNTGSSKTTLLQFTDRASASIPSQNPYGLQHKVQTALDTSSSGSRFTEAASTFMRSQNPFGVHHKDRKALNTGSSEWTSRFTEAASASMSSENPFGLQHNDQKRLETGTSETPLPRFVGPVWSQNRFGVRHEVRTGETDASPEFGTISSGIGTIRSADQNRVFGQDDACAQKLELNESSHVPDDRSSDSSSGSSTDRGQMDGPAIDESGIRTSANSYTPFVMPRCYGTRTNPMPMGANDLEYDKRWVPRTAEPGFDWGSYSVGELGPFCITRDAFYHFRCLTLLQIDHCDLVDGTVLHGLSGLRELSMVGASGIKPDAFCHLPCLTSLDIRECPSIPVMKESFQHLRQLKNLTMDVQTPSGPWLAQNWMGNTKEGNIPGNSFEFLSQLTRLSISSKETPQVPQRLFHSLTSLRVLALEHLIVEPCLGNWSSLEDLQLRSVFRNPGVEKLTGLQSLRVLDSPFVNYIDLNNLTGLTRLEVPSICKASFSNLRNLKCLTIDGCQTVTNSTFFRLHGLTSLSAMGIAGSFDDQVFDSLSNVVQLDIRENANLTDRAFHHLSNLRFVDIRGCPYVGGDILRHPPCLRRIWTDGLCHKFIDDVLKSNQGFS
eukprot:gb/GECG01015283.1/.p1 GENE.gb/GECG01015283.1/~~gb/GECG01015283.1/.p1  ORF type:complete len:929 (+),score=79.36 gb/GECG01015283.1/:1-2787(+)